MEACGFRDAISEIRALGAEVLGASADGVEAQRRFAEKFAVPFPLLCDTQKTLAKAYGALSPESRVARRTFLIDRTGTLRKVWPKVAPAGHPAEVITALKAL